MTRILILEDESHLMKLMGRILRQYCLLQAGTAEEALHCFEKSHRVIELLIADLSLPASSGVQVALTIRVELPEVPVILTSGYAISGWSERDTRDLAKLGAHSVVTLMKPFLPQALLHTVRELIGAPEERAETA